MARHHGCRVIMHVMQAATMLQAAWSTCLLWGMLAAACSGCNVPCATSNALYIYTIAQSTILHLQHFVASLACSNAYVGQNHAYITAMISMHAACEADSRGLHACSGPLPDLNGMFPALRALNASHNNFNGSIPVELGQTGIFQLGPENVGQNEVMSHVFDLSFNSLSGSVPNFLYYDVLRNYVSQGIYLQVGSPAYMSFPLCPSAYECM